MSSSYMYAALEQLLALSCILGEGLGYVLIKSTLGMGKPRGGGCRGAMGDKGDSSRATWD
jgi:hypothetical protein